MTSHRVESEQYFSIGVELNLTHRNKQIPKTNAFGILNTAGTIGHLKR